MKTKVIKTEADYESALERVSLLMDIDNPSQDNLDEMELLSVLIERYEKDQWKINPPSAVDAIRFRMEQQGLSQKDLIPLIGSKGRVSEILSGTRGLSKDMITRIHKGLGIPLEILVEAGSDSDINPHEDEIEWSRYPIQEMRKRGWIPAPRVRESESDYQSIVESFADGFPVLRVSEALLRQSTGKKMQPDKYAIDAWRIQVMKHAKKERFESEYVPGCITPAFRSEIAHLSYLNDGPLLAREFLNRNGIHLVAEAHLPHTYIDGAAMLLPDGSPVIAMTFRYDRLDNFWFVLFHELAHIALHLVYNAESFYIEDFENKEDITEEKEADQWASESLIPDETWDISGLDISSTKDDIVSFSKKIRIDPAIVAGRIRRENSNYTVLSNLLGNGTVKKRFIQTLK